MAAAPRTLCGPEPQGQAPGWESWGPSSACSSACRREDMPEAEGFCHPLHVSLPHQSHFL